MKKAILCMVLVGASVTAYGLLYRGETLELNPKLDSGMEYKPFIALWFYESTSLDPRKGKLLCLVDNAGTCYEVPSSWRASLEKVTEGQVVALPPAWHLWPRVRDEPTLQAAASARAGNVIVRPGKGVHYGITFYAPASK